MRVVSHSSSAGPFVLEGRVPGPELCSVPILPPICPLHSPRLPLESAQGLRGGVLWSSATSCVLPSAYLFSIPREFLPSGFSFFLFTHPGAKQPTEQLKMALLRCPRAIPAWHSLLPPGSGRATFLLPQRFQALLQLHY